MGDPDVMMSLLRAIALPFQDLPWKLRSRVLPLLVMIHSHRAYVYVSVGIMWFVGIARSILKA